MNNGYLDEEVKKLIGFLQEIVAGDSGGLSNDDMRATLYDYAEQAEYFLEKLGAGHENKS